MKKYKKRNTYFDSNNNYDPNEKYNSNIDVFHNKKITEFNNYEKNEIPKLNIITNFVDYLCKV